MRLALYDCPNVQCQKHPLIEKTGLIKNLLTKAMRIHIQKYYSGWIVCEDPGCSGRTRRCPLSFQRAFPICNTCFKATMYRYIICFSMNVTIYFIFSRENECLQYFLEAFIFTRKNIFHPRIRLMRQFQLQEAFSDSKLEN